MRTIIYLRQSLDLSGAGLGIARQRSETTRLCRSRGWTDIMEIVDNNKSASSGKRPGFARLISLIEQGEVDRVVILRVDRLMRLNDELELLINLVERHPVTVVTVEGDIDLSTPQGRLVARVLVSVARAEMETKSARHKLANLQKAQAGKPHGSRRPYGYEPDLITVREAEAVYLREMGRRIISGHSYREIAWWLNEEHHTTTTNRPWLSLTVRNMLMKHRYAGIRLYNGVEYPGNWQPVFDKPTWHRLQAEIKRRRHEAQHGPAMAARYLLTGLATCGKCGVYLNGQMKRDRKDKPTRPMYICRSWGDTQKKHGCGGVRRNADALDAFIRDAVIFRLDSPELQKLLGRPAAHDDELAKLLTCRADHSERLNALVDDYATGLLDRAQFARAKVAAQTELDRIDREINAIGRSSHVSGLVSAGETVRQAWDKNGNDWRRELIKLLVESVEVRPGRTKPFYEVDGKRYRFDPSLITINWKI